MSVLMTEADFEDRYMPVTESGCFIWLMTVNKEGYGVIKIRGKQYRAHRLSFEIHKEPIPSGLLVLHQCDNPSCVNPDHLFLGTNKDNAVDRSNKGRSNNGRRSRTHCPSGHPLSGSNLYTVPKSGKRSCKICAKATGRRTYLRLKLKNAK